MNFKSSTLLFVFLLTALFAFAQQDIDGSFEHDGNTRLYRVHLPTGYMPGDNLPLVINLHGFGSTSLEQLVYSNFNALADTAKIMVVYPQGLVGTTTWGAVGSSWDAYFGTGIDDLGFIDELIDRLYTDYNIDLSRVYSTGMSNGGFMSYRLACELSDRVAAIASVTGSMAFSQISNCTPNRSVPVLEIHGTSDLVVNYNGITGFTPSIPSVVDFWVNHNSCDPTPTMITVPNVSVIDNTTTTAERYTCDEDTKVWLYTVANGSHTWPGAFPIPGAGTTSQDFSATQLIWEFFSQYTHPNPREGTIVSTSEVTPVSEWMNVFPNPFTDQLTIQLKSDEIETVRLRDLLGRTIMEMESLQGQQDLTLTTASLQSGFYFLEASTQIENVVIKLVKE